MIGAMRAIALCFAALLVVCCAAPASATLGATGTVPAVRAPHPLPLDPTLSDPAWETGKLAVAPSYMDLTTRRPAPVETTTYLLYDDRNIYVAFHAEQRGIPIVAGQPTNNVGFGIDDFVGVGLDPGGSGSQVYWFETTPRGTRYQQASANARFAPQWGAAARTRPDGWDAVMIIPLDALRVGGGKQRWRIDFARQLATTGEHLVWGYDGLMNDAAVGNGWPSFNDVRFWPWLDGVALAGRSAAAHRPRADVYGLLSGGKDRQQFAQADGAFSAQSVRNTGLDVVAPLTDTIDFVGTLAPDFSNVEVDQQTIAPQEFRRQLAEYRPFFAQGAAFLSPNQYPIGGQVAPQNLIFYSPGIGPFDRGAKVEGTHGNDAFGVLSVRGTGAPGIGTFDDIAYGFKHALPNRTFQYWADGVLAHHELQGSDETTEAGMLGRNLKSGFVWLANTSVEHGSAPNGASHSSNAFVDVHKPNYEVNLGYDDIGPHYGPLDGFTASSDIRGPQATLYLMGNGSRVKNWFFTLYGDRFRDGSGAVHQADTLVSLNATFKNGLSINGLGPQTGVLRSYELPSGPNCSGPSLGRSAYTGAPCYRNGRTDRFDLFAANFGYRDGTPAPLDWGYSVGPFGGTYLHQFTSSTSRPLGGRWSIALEYDGTWERSFADGSLDSQFLRKIALSASLDANTNVALALRTINGDGGFALPGTNLSATFHRHFPRGDELYLDFGTPASTTTLDRIILKYVLHLGPLAGT